MASCILRSGALGSIAIASILNVGAASAGPCTREIAEFQNALPRDVNGEPTFVGTAPQSIGAQPSTSQRGYRLNAQKRSSEPNLQGFGSSSIARLAG
jgi:hypothetical protein